MATKRNPKVMRGGRLVVNLTLDPDQVQRIDRMADQRRTSRAAIVREALDIFFAVSTARGDITRMDSNTEAAA